MKRISSLAMVVACGILATPVFAAEPLCEAKQADIRTQIEQAKAAGNSEQQAGLEKALSENTEHCTDKGLIKQQEGKVLMYLRLAAVRIKYHRGLACAALQVNSFSRAGGISPISSTII